MFGRNIPIKPVYEPRSKLNVIKVWPTIQGEGPFTGSPAIFVRLAGCNLRCYFCDTEFSEGAREVEIPSLVEAVDNASPFRTDLVVITGGEPLAQPIAPFIAALASRGYHVQIETAGTVWQEGIEDLYDGGYASIVCSPKTATVHKGVIQYCRHWKYIISAGKTSPQDGLPIRSTQDPYDEKSCALYRPPIRAQEDTIWVQPCDEYRVTVERPVPDLEHNVEKIKDNIIECVRVAQKYGYRISFQLHKVLGVE